MSGDVPTHGVTRKLSVRIAARNSTLTIKGRLAAMTCAVPSITGTISSLLTLKGTMMGELSSQSPADDLPEAVMVPLVDVVRSLDVRNGSTSTLYSVNETMLLVIVATVLFAAAAGVVIALLLTRR